MPGSQLPLNVPERPVRRTVRDMDDGELLQDFVTHHRDRAFGELVRRHGQLVWNVCRSVLHHDQDTEDAFQATFLVLARKAGSISKRHCLAAWLYKVAFRIALRARAKRLRCPQQETLPAADAAPPRTATEHGDLSGLVVEEVQRLPEKYKLPVLLCYLQGQTNEEAARQLRCPTGTVKVRLMRAREILRRRLVRRGIGLSLAAALAAWAVPAQAAQFATLQPHVVRSCADVAAGIPAAATGLSDAAVHLADGWFRHVALAKVKLSAAVLLVIGLLFGADHLLQSARAAAPAAVKGKQVAPAPPTPDADVFVQKQRRLHSLPF